MKKQTKPREEEHQKLIHEHVVAFLTEAPEPHQEEWAIRAAIERELRRLFKLKERECR